MKGRHENGGTNGTGKRDGDRDGLGDHEGDEGPGRMGIREAPGSRARVLQVERVAMDKESSDAVRVVGASDGRQLRVVDGHGIGAGEDPGGLVRRRFRFVDGFVRDRAFRDSGID